MSLSDRHAPLAHIFPSRGACRLRLHASNVFQEITLARLSAVLLERRPSFGDAHLPCLRGTLMAVRIVQPARALLGYGVEHEGKAPLAAQAEVSGVAFSHFHRPSHALGLDLLEAWLVGQPPEITGPRLLHTRVAAIAVVVDAACPGKLFRTRLTQHLSQAGRVCAENDL